MKIDWNIFDKSLINFKDVEIGETFIIEYVSGPNLFLKTSPENAFNITRNKEAGYDTLRINAVRKVKTKIVKDNGYEN